MAAAGAAATKDFINLTAREVHLLVRNLLHIEGCEAAIMGGNITGALLATVTSKDDLKNPQFSLPIDDRQARKLFINITEVFIPDGISSEDIHVRYNLFIIVLAEELCLNYITS
jgi:hypothetical protein